MKMWYEIYQKVTPGLALTVGKADTPEEADTIRDELEAELCDKFYIDKWIKDEKGERPVTGNRSESGLDILMATHRRRKVVHQGSKELIWS